MIFLNNFPKDYKNRLLYIALGLIILLIILYEAQGKGDFNIFVSASRDLLSGKNIYEIKYNQWYHYYYDVVFALILVPFSYLPLYLVKILWLILNVFFVFRIWKIITGWLPISDLNNKIKTVFVLLSFLFIFRFLRDNFHLSQVTIFILYLTLEGLSMIDKDKKLQGSGLIALGINIKLLPLVIIPYLIYRNDWKSVFYIISGIIVLLFLPVMVLGFDYNWFLLTERWKLLNPSNQTHILDTSERSFHSLTTFLATLLVKNSGDSYALGLKRNIANISIENLNLVINIVRGAFVLFSLYFLRTKPFISRISKVQKLYEISYVCLIIPLIFPHQQHYAFFFIFPATTYLVYYMLWIYFSPNINENKYHKCRKIGFVTTMVISYFLTNSHLILGQFTDYYDHFKTLTYGILMILVLLALSKPNKLPHYRDE